MQARGRAEFGNGRSRTEKAGAVRRNRGGEHAPREGPRE